jgi:hypothetical protein
VSAPAITTSDLVHAQLKPQQKESKVEKKKKERSHPAYLSAKA